MRLKQSLIEWCIVSRQIIKCQAFITSFCGKAIQKKKILGACIDSYTPPKVD